MAEDLYQHQLSGYINERDQLHEEQTNINSAVEYKIPADKDN